jgi:ATP-binding cassette, subfamily B, bacterial
MQSAWKKLADSQETPLSRWMALGFGLASALLTPFLLVLLGWFAQLLFVVKIGDGKRILPQQLNVGQWFSISTERLSSETNLLRCAITLIVLIVGVFIAERVCLLLSRRSAMKASLEWTSRLLRRLFHQARSLSMEHGLSGQRKTLRDIIQADVPRVRDAFTEWYRQFPRCLVQTLGVLVLACCIHPWLTLLSIIALIVGWGLFISLEAAQRKNRPVLVEQRRTAHEQLIYLCESSPLLESVDDRVDVEKLFERQIESFNQAQFQIADEGTLRSPWLLACITLLGTLLLFVLGIRVLEPASTLHVGDILALVGCVVVSVSGIFKLRRGWRKRVNAAAAAESIANYLAITSTRGSTQSKTLTKGIQTAIQLEHVSFRDSSRNRVLDDVTLTLKPGAITAIVAMDQPAARALSELVLGFGIPASGRILIDDIDLIDLDVMSLRRQSLLVNERGPLLDGTVEENLLAGANKNATVDIMEVARKVHVSEAILNLPDGLGTILTNNDDRLPPDQLYRLGVARALLKKPCVVVAYEPKQRVSAQEESESLSALKSLKELGAIVVVIPERLSTLRLVDQVIVFKDGKVIDTGSHQKLLETSDIYRHFNYMRFAFS